MQTSETPEAPFAAHAIVECVNAVGFPQQLTAGRHYVIDPASWGDYWVVIANDAGDFGSYRAERFRSTGTFADHPVRPTSTYDFATDADGVTTDVRLLPGDGTPGTPPVNFPGIEAAPGHDVVVDYGFGPLEIAVDQAVTESLGSPRLPDGNPKTRFGVAKPPLSLIPGLARVQVAEAFRDGARKYGAANWRIDPVTTSTYLNAAERHLVSWQDGEELAADSGVHHLAHAAACLMILLDAQAAGTLQDDRPTPVDTAGLIRTNTKAIA